MILRPLIAILLLSSLLACRAGPTLDDENAEPVAPTTVSATTPLLVTPAVANTATVEPSPTVEIVPTTTALPAPPTRLSEVSAWLDGVALNNVPLETARQVLLESEWIESEADFRLIAMRSTGDEVWVVRATLPPGENNSNPFGLPGGVFVVDPNAGALVYEQFGQAALISDEEFAPSPTVLTDTDFTGDEILDLLFRLTNCGANTCYDEYHIVSYHESDSPRDVIRAAGFTADGQLADDLPFATMSYSDAYIGDQNSDSIRDLQLGGGTQGSVGAGPQRARFETYSWDGENVVLVETEYDESPFRYFRLVDANAAFAEADYELARSLYDEVLSDETLEDTGYVAEAGAERAALERYATYRLVLLDILVEDYVGAQRRAEEMVDANPGDPIATGALETVLTFARTNSLTDACAAFTASVETLDPDPLAPLDTMGYGNTELSAETLCPL